MSRAEIEATNRKFSELVAKGDAAPLGAYYTSNARLLAPNAPMFEGREAIVAFFGEFMKAGDLSLTLETVDVEELGDDVLEVGRYTLTITPAQGDAQKDEGKYVVVWRREDGSVKLHVDMFNTSLPPA